MLALFLSMNTSTTTLANRCRRFEQSDLYRQHETFFNDHFAKYPVFSMDFSHSLPSTAEAATSILWGNVISACKGSMEYFDTLANTFQEGNLGRFASIGDMKLAIRGIQEAHEKFRTDSSITGSGCGGFLKALMEVLYNCPGGQGSVVTIDEYDKPIFYALHELGISEEAREDIANVYSQFYTTIFKNNLYLRLGLMVGVFKVPLSGVLSEENSANVF
ncbi:hypothetical protein GGI19_001892 [Coemansia pectinata]|uniref:AAA-ATPase-like domain-containing protein n=1 Tax=Coemansia pectinata TaxID=1052879 RepID=A0A9W8H0S2_9FUNG|nr:hypothetical protein GGI19_001892 [Coemansia pectinata]